MTEGEVVLARLSAAPGRLGALRPALVVRRLPGYFPAFLLCGISSRLDRVLEDWDIVVDPQSPAASQTGLKVASVIRPSWLMTVPAGAELPLLGAIPPEMLNAVQKRLAALFAGR